MLRERLRLSLVGCDAGYYETYDLLFQLCGLWETIPSEASFAFRRSGEGLSVQSCGIILHDSYPLVSEGKSCLYKLGHGVESSTPGWLLMHLSWSADLDPGC